MSKRASQNQGPVKFLTGPFFFEAGKSYFVCIIRNETTGKQCIGQASDRKARIDRHNREYGRDHCTRTQEGPWELVYSEELETRSAVMRRERYLKSGKGTITEIEAGLIKMTIPDNPRSPHQQYRIPPRGKEVLKKYKKVRW